MILRFQSAPGIDAGRSKESAAIAKSLKVSIRSRHRCREKQRTSTPSLISAEFQSAPGIDAGRSRPQQTPSESSRCTAICAKAALTSRQRQETICGLAEKSNLIKLIQIGRAHV